MDDPSICADPAIAHPLGGSAGACAVLGDRVLMLAPGNRLLLLDPGALGPLPPGGRAQLRRALRPAAPPPTSLAQPSRAARAPASQVAVSCTYALGGHAVQLGFGDAACEQLVDPLWSQYRQAGAAQAPGSTRLRLVHAGPDGGYRVTRNGRTLAAHATPAEAKGLVTRELVETLHGQRRWLAVLHASAVDGPQGAIAFAASPMSGKSTLAAALARSGFRHFADDCLPVARSDGQARSVPAAVSLREGSWRVLARRLPELATLPVHRVGPERVRYWFAHPADQVRAQASPIRCLVFPRFQPGQATELLPLTPVEALVRLIESGSGPLLPLDAGGLADFAAWLAATPAYTLRYGALGGALAAVRRLAAR